MTQHATPHPLTDAQRLALLGHVRDTNTSVYEQLDQAGTPVELHTAMRRMAMHGRVAAAVVEQAIVLDEPMRELLTRERDELLAHRRDLREFLDGLHAGEPGHVYVGMSVEVSERVTADELAEDEGHLAALDELLAAY